MMKILKFLFCVGFLIFVYARFVEPQIILVHDYEVENDNLKGMKIAVFSDPHIGTYKSSNFLERVVKKVNSENPDLVIIPGDFVYLMAKNGIKYQLEPLEDLIAPSYAVLGNHDLLESGEFSKEEMYGVLENLGIIMVDNRSFQINLGDQTITVAGIGSIFAKDDYYEHLLDTDETSPLLVVAHNPDSAFEIPEMVKVDLIIAGHTHGGQIRVPWLYKKVIPTEHQFDQGFYEVKGNQVFVTSGVGEVILPMRFMIPPSIDILEFQ